jgi:hypothetical protein
MFDLIPIGSIGSQSFDEVVLYGAAIATIGYSEEKRHECRDILRHSYDYEHERSVKLKSITDALVTLHKLGWAEVINIQDVIYNAYSDNFERIKKIKEIQGAQRKII